MKRLAPLLSIVLLASIPRVTLGYNNTVHYFLTVVVTENIAPPLTDDERRLISFCAQLPDETEKLDAAKQYQSLLFSSGSYLRWAFTGNDSGGMEDVLNDSEAAREMVTVQQLLHALTGGSGREMLITADNITKSLTGDVDRNDFGREKSEKLCAVGFAVHLLADALGHRQLDSGGLQAEGRMYPTGKGHAFDGTRPDDIFGSVTGLDGIVLYDGKIPSSFPEARTLAASISQGLHSRLKAASHKWFRASAAAREILVDESGDWAKQPGVRPDEHDNENCQAYLNGAVPIIARDLCVPRCEDVFIRFAKVAIPEFANSHGSRVPKLAPNKYVFPQVDGEALPCSGHQ